MFSSLCSLSPKYLNSSLIAWLYWTFAILAVVCFLRLREFRNNWVFKRQDDLLILIASRTTVIVLAMSKGFINRAQIIPELQLLLTFVAKRSQRVGAPGLDSRLSTYWSTKWSSKWRCNQQTSVDQTPVPCVPASNQKGGCVKSGCSGSLKPDRFGLSCKANKCSDAGTGDLGVLTIHKISPCPGWMPPQVQVSKLCR